MTQSNQLNEAISCLDRIGKSDLADAVRGLLVSSIQSIATAEGKASEEDRGKGVSLSESEEIQSRNYMDIYSKPGTKVVFMGGNETSRRYRGYDDYSALKIGSTYTIKRCDVYSDHTCVFLEEVPGSFNSVWFDSAMAQEGEQG